MFKALLEKIEKLLNMIVFSIGIVAIFFLVIAVLAAKVKGDQTPDKPRDKGMLAYVTQASAP